MNSPETQSTVDREDVDALEAPDTATILVYTIDAQAYGLFLCDVERMVRAVAVTPLLEAPDTILGVINVQGRVMPVVNTRRKLQLPDRAVALDDQFIVARTAKRLVALAVDSVEGVLERPKAEVITGEEVVPGLENLKGILKLDDALILIYDLDRFLFSEEEKGLDDALARN